MGRSVNSGSVDGRKTVHFKMFDEYEPGKPQNWGSTIGIIIVICTLNVGILVGLRMLLEMRDGLDEPLLSSAQQNLVIELLGVFALSFGFGCCCCFCCAGRCPGYTKKGARFGYNWCAEWAERRKIHDLDDDLVSNAHYEPYSPGPNAKDGGFRLATTRPHPLNVSQSTISWLTPTGTPTSRSFSNVRQLDPTNVTVIPITPNEDRWERRAESTVATTSPSPLSPASTVGSSARLLPEGGSALQHEQLMHQLHRFGLLPPPDSPSRRLSCPTVPSFWEPHKHQQSFNYPPFR
ncbi:hypothetical protein M3Y99_00658900 [Aphelenchoides fujianensis]|nr:hypothetical protein M3Y99_00658900 [Aphelenchoides fujianensis]